MRDKGLKGGWRMKRSLFAVAMIACASFLVAAEPDATLVGGAIPNFNRKVPSPQLTASSSFGDTVIAHVADGFGWQTTITVLNLRPTATTFTIACFGDNGKAQTFSWSGVGNFPTLAGTISGYGSREIATNGTGSSLSQGWCNVDSPNDVASFAIFSYAPNGQQVTVPGSRWFLENSANSLILAYNNTGGYVYGVALADSTVFTYSGEPSDVIGVTFKDQSGNVTGTSSFQMIPGSHMSFVLTDKWPSLANTKGTITFQMQTGFISTLAGLAMRTTPGLAFTSVEMFEPTTY